MSDELEVKDTVETLLTRLIAAFAAFDQRDYVKAGSIAEDLEIRTGAMKASTATVWILNRSRKIQIDCAKHVSLNAAANAVVLAHQKTYALPYGKHGDVRLYSANDVAGTVVSRAEWHAALRAELDKVGS